MRIIVCGDRNFTNVQFLWRALDAIDAATPGGITRVIEGASDDVTGEYVGVDYWANQWARAHGIKAKRYHAQWQKFGKAAGPIRNKKMLAEECPDAVVSFPGGPGTADMVSQAHKARVRVIPVDPSAHATDCGSR